MPINSLPYVVLLVLTELAVGCLWALAVLQARSDVAWSFLKFGGAVATTLAALALAVSVLVPIPEEVEGYLLNEELAGPARGLLALFLGAASAYTLTALKEEKNQALAMAAVGSVAGLGAIALWAGAFYPPTWGYMGAFLSLSAGAAVVGSAVMGMILGHWYLVTPRLSERPLTALTVLLMMAFGLQGLVTALGLLLPHDSLSGDDTGSSFPFLWLRVGGGMVFPFALAYMAYQCSATRAMQSATGLLYIVMALVLAGEVVAKGLLLATGVAL